jgi:hypothetical protein
MSIDSALDYVYVIEMKMINYRHMLMSTQNGLILLKLNYDSWEATAVSINRRYVRTLVVDELNERRFLIVGSIGFSIGTLIEDEFVVGTERGFDLSDFQCPKLSGDRLIGFRNFGRNSWKFCRVDLNTLAEERVDVHFDLGDYDWVSFYTLFLITVYFRIIVIAGPEIVCTLPFMKLEIRYIFIFVYLLIILASNL